MSFREIPAPGFALVSGRRAPPSSDQRYFIQLRNGFVDDRTSYTAEQLRWKHDGSPGDIVAVRKAGDDKPVNASWTPKSGGY